MDTLDPKLKEALLKLPGSFSDFEKASVSRFTKLEETLDELPKRILNTTIKVKNGSEKEVKLVDAVTQNWEMTSRLEINLAEGNVWIPIKNSQGFIKKERLGDVLTELNTRPSRWFSNSAQFGDGFSKILRLVVEIGAIGYMIYTLIKLAG